MNKCSFTRVSTVFRYVSVHAEADPGRNLTRAQQKACGRGYMGVGNISEL